MCSWFSKKAYNAIFALNKPVVLSSDFLRWNEMHLTTPLDICCWKEILYFKPKKRQRKTTLQEAYAKCHPVAIYSYISHYIHLMTTIIDHMYLWSTSWLEERRPSKLFLPAMRWPVPANTRILICASVCCEWDWRCEWFAKVLVKAYGIEFSAVIPGRCP